MENDEEEKGGGLLETDRHEEAGSLVHGRSQRGEATVSVHTSTHKGKDTDDVLKATRPTSRQEKRECKGIFWETVIL